MFFFWGIRFQFSISQFVSAFDLYITCIYVCTYERFMEIYLCKYYDMCVGTYEIMMLKIFRHFSLLTLLQIGMYFGLSFVIIFYFLKKNNKY